MTAHIVAFGPDASSVTEEQRMTAHIVAFGPDASSVTEAGL